MASKKDNIKSLFQNTRSRVIIVFTLALLLILVVVGIFKLRGTSAEDIYGSSNVSGAPSGIQSIPGALDPTAEYAKLQELQNVSQAQTATQTGGSAIPTIIRSQALGQGVNPVGMESGQKGVGFAALSMEDEGGPQRSLWIQELKDSNCSKTVMNKVLSEGASIKDLKQGCSCLQLKDNGYKLKDLDTICACKELKAAGVGAIEFKQIGYDAQKLKICGYDACAMKAAGFSAQEMKDGGYSDGELQGAGFSDEDIAKTSGIPDGLTAADVRGAGCSANALAKLRQAGVSASAIKNISGCSADILKAAGFSAADLKGAGYSAADLKNAGFSADQLKAAGFNARDLLNAGFSPDDLKKAGFSNNDIKAAEAQLPPGMTPDDVKNSGCDINTLKLERLAGVSATAIKQYAGCSAAALKQAGFNDDDLANAGYSSAEIKASGQVISDADVKKAGCDPDKLKILMQSGVSAKRIHQLNGCSSNQLTAGGFTADDVAKAVGEDILGSKNPITAIGLGRTPNCNIDSLKAARASGVSARTIKETLGCSADALKAAGYNAQDLKNAGFSAAELKSAGYTAQELKAAGFSAKALKNAGFSDAALKAAGFAVKEAPTNVAGLEVKGPQTTSSGIPSVAIKPIEPQAQAVQSSQSQQLEKILEKQNQQLDDQRFQAKIQQRTSEMVSSATQFISGWKAVTTQSYTEGSDKEDGDKAAASEGEGSTLQSIKGSQNSTDTGQAKKPSIIIKTGDILFAVIDTSVNTDEPGPILATIISGRLKGSKLIGSFNLPNNAEKMVITFNTLSVKGADKTTSVSAYAIDPNTARTALSSASDHHYLLRYGSLFASSFLQGFGNAFQSANTTVTVGGTGGGNDVTVSNGVGRSALENAVIGMATLGKTWGQFAQQQFNKPITVEVYSGTTVGVLFTQDLRQ